MRKPVVLVDMDGVVADFTGYILQSLAVAGVVVDYNQLSGGFGFDEQPALAAHMDLIDTIIMQPGAFGKLVPIDGAQEAIDRLAQRYQVRFCSSPLPGNPTCETDKRVWLEQYFGSVYAEEAFIGRDKTICPGDVLIDDKAIITGSQAPSWQHIIFDQPWNHGVDKVRLLGWQDLTPVDKLLATL